MFKIMQQTELSAYLCLYFHLQDGAGYSQYITDYDQHIPAVQELFLVVLTHFTVKVFVEEL